MSTHDTATEDWLDGALEAAGREHRAGYIADEGFTARVIGCLPVAPTLPAWRRPAIAALWLLGGAAAMVALPGAFDNAFRGAVALIVARPFHLADIAVMLALCGAAAWGALFYAARTG
ncbi:MAG: hypothetical protein ACHP7M_01075 [Burkholderiales bacterium]|jgi:hypothetical protein